MRKANMQIEAAEKCPELLLAALEDATIDIAYIKQLISTIAENVDTVANFEPLKRDAEEIQ